ncbi:hypothetical protein OSB04_009660 [Centaurea solstitialis]|uniref:EamA domain-containing protein n=1 Tax=Centaurea solstitialis TaxID=347529 RepID=A0AA38TJ88_9ASTR|nr:hypothetical protein OSB04_009660 [Centaurea solstitialis]
MDILSKAALNEGISNYVFVVYRHAVATIVMTPFAIVFDKKTRPKMTCSIFIKLMILALLEPVIDQNLYFMGMKATTATFAAAMCNILPAITFVMACVLRLEKVNVKSIRSQAKVIGTVITLAGAMMMTLLKGPVLELFWTKGRTHHQLDVKSGVDVDLHNFLMGSFMITVGCFSWSAFMVLQAITLESYAVELSLTAWICLLGTVEGAIVALIMERGNPSAWAIRWDMSLVATLYSGIICSGLTYYIQGLIMKVRGPVFVTAFSPLSMIIVAVMGSIILAEQMYLERVIGAIVIVTGLYLVVWGKSKDDKLSSEQMVAKKQVMEKDLEENCYDKMSKDAGMSEFFNKGKPFFAVIFLQFGFAGMDIISKVALNEGMSNYVFVVYQHAVATIVITPFAIVFDKKIRPKMTRSIFIKLMILALLDPVINQNLYFMGMKATTATFAAAMCNVLPAITFVMACILRLEKVNVKSIRSQAKVIGTVTSLAGAMMMTLLKGPVLELFWTKGRTHHQPDVKSGVDVDLHNSLMGSFMITVGCFSWSAFMVLQAITLESYPVELSLTAWICLLGTAEGAILALIMERGKPAAWAIRCDMSLVAALYSGIVCSSITYYIQGLIMKVKDPVFVTAFSPLSMIIVAVMGSIILAEQMYLGRVIGAIAIVTGLYLVVWGKSKDDDKLSSEKMVHEKQLMKKELEENCHDNKVINIQASDEVAPINNGVFNDHN